MKLRVLFLAALLTTPVMADENDGTGMLSKNILTGLGFLPKDQPDIKYRERAPLVLPPSLNGGQAALPAPVDPASKRNAQWPKDYDQNEARKPKISPQGTQGRLSEGRKMTPDELRQASAVPISRPTSRTGDTAGNVPMANPNGGSLFSRVGEDKNQRIEFKGEGQRTALTEPPSGYKTPSASQPFGPVGQTNYKAPVVDNTGKDAKKNR